MTQPFSLRFARMTRFGALAAVALPAGTEPVDDVFLARLLPDEAQAAQAERGRRQVEHVGGRLAWAHACRALGVEPAPLRTGARGEPLAPVGLTVSISHKNDVALALVAADGDGTVGLDLEGGGREPVAIASRVLQPTELAEFDALPPLEQWPWLLLRFAVKEATYKAIHPHLKRFVSFQEARVVERPLGVELSLAEPGPSLELEVMTETLDDRLLAFVRARCR